MTLSPSRRLYIVLAILIAAGSFLRLYALGHQSYWMDEGYTINAVTAIVEKGSSILDSGQAYHCPLYCYPTAWLVLSGVEGLVHNPAIVYRLLAALAGIAFIPLIWYIVRRMFDQRIALVTTLFVTFSYWQIAWSRQARWYTLYELFFWAALYCFYEYLAGPKRRVAYGIAASSFTILTIATHAIGMLLPLVMLAYFAWHVYRNRISMGMSWTRVGIIAFAILETIVLAEWFSGNHFIGAILSHVSLHYELPYWLNFYLRTYWLFVPFLLFAAFNTASPYAKPLRFILLPLGAYFIAFSFFTDIVHYRYLFALTPVLFIGASIGIIDLAIAIKNRPLRRIFLSIILTAFFASGMGVWQPMSHYWLESDDSTTLGTRPHYAYTPQPDWNAAYAYIQEHQQLGDVVISSNPVFTKIFLNQPGSWIRYNYLGVAENGNNIDFDHEYYVNARVIDNLTELRAVTTGKHGWVVIDSMALDGRIGPDVQEYIAEHFTQVIHLTTNAWSEIWVWKF